MTNVFTGGDEQKIAFDVYGSESAQPVILLHGLSSNRHVYDHLTTDLRARLDTGQLQLINPDLRGHGDSSHALSADEYRASDYASDIVRVLRSRTDQQALVITESLGGVVALAIAQAEPGLIRGMFLEDPPLFLGDPERFATNEISKDFPEFIELVQGMQARSAPVAEYDSVLRDDSEPDPLDETTRYLDGLPSWDVNSMRAAVTGVLWDGCNPLLPTACPLTVLRADPAKGAAFTEEDAREFAIVNPHARIAMIEGATHSLRTTRHPQFLEELQRFIGSAESPGVGV